MKISIVIPAYNEGATILQVLKKIGSVNLQGFEKEIIIVDDGSTDSTAEKLKGLNNIKLIVHQKNQGKGAAIKTAIKEAEGDFFLIQDADLEYHPEDYNKLLKPLIDKECDVVYGNRFPLYKGNRLSLNYFGNRFLSFMTCVLYGKIIQDMETGYKVFRREVIKGLNLNSNRFNFEPELTASLIKKGYKIKEIPIKYTPRSRKEGKKITLLDGIKAAFCLIKYRFRD